MRNTTIRWLPLLALLALLLMAALSSSCAIALHAAKEGAWMKLGGLQVRDRVERDTFRVGPRKETFDSIRLKVEGRAVQFRDLEIHFENGTVQPLGVCTSSALEAQLEPRHRLLHFGRCSPPTLSSEWCIRRLRHADERSDDLGGGRGDSSECLRND